MDPTASIRKLGFRRWYERQLIDCHAALVTCLLCGLTVAALLEQVNFRDFGWKPFYMMLYPNKTHSISGPVSQGHLYDMMTRFLNENLKGAEGQKVMQ